MTDLDFTKYTDGLIPAIVQDAGTLSVLMLGFMNAEAVERTRESGLVTFYSRTRRRLWTKGEESGNYLRVVEVTPDCDSDTLLITARPAGPVCHNGWLTCFGDSRPSPSDRVMQLESVIDDRRQNMPDGSHVARLFAKGINKIAQKVGEEAVELVIEAKDDDRGKFVSEAADLMFHYLVLLRAKDVSFSEVLDELDARRR